MQSLTNPIPAGMSVSLGIIDRAFTPAELQLRSSVLPTGEFQIDPVFPHDFDLKVNGLPQGYYLKQVRQSGRDIRNSPARPGAEVSILLGVDGPMISGTAVDSEGEPVADAIVVIAEQTTNGRPVLSLQTDHNGRFSQHSGLAPGKYDLIAFTGIPGYLAQDPELLRQHRAGAKSITLEPRDRQQNLVLEVVRPAR